MLQITNRFSTSASRGQNINQRTVQNNAQSVSFSGNMINKTKLNKLKPLLMLAAALTAALGLNSAVHKVRLEKDIASKVSSYDEFQKIKNNSNLLCEHRTLTANSYLSDVKDSLDGKKVEPFLKHNIAPLYKKEALEDATRILLKNAKAIK